ncbi:uncharacterized protein IUM83_17364 [Phytophthora cinnamomi]|uniref:uncharacterized protein n=1 Tax=Phytophthora cinnamomi TaxID=4785 RepID=UPI00355A54D8|nr:hypothetical protein IUM83_17364 [Phytophthora cinnamomi]
MDADDAVYASILARVARPELDEQLHTVLRKECSSIGRQMRRASSSLAAARQLQAAAEFLRPSGDWRPKTLQTQLKGLEQLQSRLEAALEQLERGGRRTRTKKKRKRPVGREEEEVIETKEKSEEEEKLRGGEVIVLDGDDDDDDEVVQKDKSEEVDQVVEAEVQGQKEEDEDSGVEVLEVVTLGDTGTDVETKPAECEMEDSEEPVAEEMIGDDEEVEDESEVEILEVVAEQERIEESVVVECVKEESALLESHVEGDDGDGEAGEEIGVLPNGLVRTTSDTIVRVKQEPVVVLDQQTLVEVGQNEMCETATMDEAEMSQVVESPMELEVLESSEESAVDLEMSDSEQSAMELEVLESDSDADDFSLCQELVTKLQNGNDATQLAMFPQTVAQLRLYLLECKHLEVDEYLFVHKRITDKEFKEMGRAIEALVDVGMDLPMRPRIKMALNDLLTIVEQLEHALGELPAFLLPVIDKLSNFFLPIAKKTLTSQATQ